MIFNIINKRKIEEYKNSARYKNKIAEFKEKFNNTDKYSIRTLLRWHFMLTGSCQEGRNGFVKEHNINLDDEITVKEFLEAAKGRFGWEMLKDLEEFYK